MSAPHSSDVAQCLKAAAAGESSAAQRLTESVYVELRGLAARILEQESPGHTLQPTALVHEAFLRLVDQRNVDLQGRTHFFAVAAQSMRRILVDHARKKMRQKRGGRRRHLSLDERLVIRRECEEDVLAVEEALNRLAEMDQQQATIVELRFFGGLSVGEVAAVLQLSKRTVEREWTAIRAWLRQQLAEDKDS